ncbi:sugar transferase [Nocardioides sp. TRM66260-LWL]|uniref:sugar transferase n=1 Tax=Nocardioides sp. TRM66260-LWL TaxID=2874478 RepID=UPI001CC4D3E8|nr:sugar transferase [Nocardioides sp. TRM66260-LWL]MBZ5734949.1 sugar transferase [Nocardioides sp. TRM66260-LWL]
MQTRTASRALRFLPSTAVVLDAGAIVLAVVVAVAARQQLSVGIGQVDLTSSALVVGPLILAAWVTITYLLRGYRENVFGAGTDEFKRVVNAGIYTAALVGVACYLAKFQLSRAFFATVFLLGTVLILLARLGLRRLLHAARRHGILRQRALLVGTPAQVDEVAAVLRRESWLGYDLVGALSEQPVEETHGGIPVLGTLGDVVALAESDTIDTVFLAGGGIGSSEEMRRLVWSLESHGVRIIIAPSVNEISSDRIRVRPVGGLPLMHISPPTARDAGSLAKRLFDVVGATALLTFFAPVLALIALSIWLDDRGPVLFRQTRTGRHGEEFSCLKFRTMVVDAEARLAALKEQMGFEGGLFKMTDDPRITKAGKLLRRLSLDELPQLVNVVRGDMSLVGPRPPLPSEVATYTGDIARRLHVRPGLTGLWQVSGRSDLSFEEAVRLDLYYVDNWSMMQDLTILARTVSAVLGSKGAY